MGTDASSYNTEAVAAATMFTGYLHPDYAASFSELGTPALLPASAGWILRRQIADTGLCDASGCYPLFTCADWHGLPDDVDALEDKLVALVIVTDPLGDYTLDLLRDAFDRVIPFKEHFVIETGLPLDQFITPSHRTQARRALKDVDVELCSDPVAVLDEWERLYAVLIARHSIRGLRRFSRTAVEKQLRIPGIVAFRAVAGDRTVGLDLWYVQGDCAQGHLAAFDDAGYELHASYATKWRAIEYLSQRVRWINLGAATTRDPSDGLARFKSGWATATRTAWLCGRVLQAKSYEKLAGDLGSVTSYFPAYRHGEFD